MDTRIESLRLIGAEGTNKVMAGELSRLAVRALGGARLAEPRKVGTGGLVYPFSLELAHLAAWYHRTSSRVLWDLFATDATRLEPLYDEILAAMRDERRGWLWDGARLSVRARNVADFAAGERQIIGTVKNAVIDGAAARGMRVTLEPDAPDVLLAVRMHDGELTVSVNLGGRSMNERGYRLEAGLAPLRENLGAALIMLSRWDARKEVLLDPMSGSGTIGIEAALMARAATVWVPPRRPALVHLPAFAGLADRPVAPLFADTAPMVITNELDTRVVAEGRANMAAAGVADQVVSLHGDFRTLKPERLARALGRRPDDLPPGVIVCNPAYGERIDTRDVTGLYADLRAWAAELRGWRAAFLVGNPDFEAAFGGRPRIKKPLRNGQMRAYFYMYDL